MPDQPLQVFEVTELLGPTDQAQFTVNDEPLVIERPSADLHAQRVEASLLISHPASAIYGVRQ